MKKFFTLGSLFAALACTAFTASAHDAVPGPPPESDARATQLTSRDASLDRIFGQEVSLTSRMEEAAQAACGPGCSTSRGNCGATGGCDGGSRFDLACPFASDQPLLGFLRDQEISECLTFSAGGELRHRAMDERNRLRPGGPGDSTYDLWRLTPWVELNYGDDVTAHVEAIDASIFNRDLPITAIDENRADLLQYYVDAKIAELGDGNLRLRVGRQFLQYGSQQLVSPLAWSNTFRNFEGLRLYYSSSDWDIDGFAVRTVNGAAGNIFRPTSADHADQSHWFSGVYSTYKGCDNGKLDLYWLWSKEDGNQAGLKDDRHTVGARWAATSRIEECGVTVGTWALDIEGAYQFGDTQVAGPTNQDIRAGFFTSKLGYTWNQGLWTPTIKGVFYWGSGDNSATDGTNNNFNTLFPLGHAYWGIIDNLNGSNLLDYSIQTSVKPCEKFSLNTDIHWFVKENAGAPIFNVANAPFGPGGAIGTGNKYIGSELDLVGTYTFSKNLSTQAGYSWFWYGQAVSNNPAIARGDATQFYVMTTLKF
jgi:hypothetical protein